MCSVTKELPTAQGMIQILPQISFTVPRGGTVAIVGRSGSGKSTLLAILAGLELPTSGHVILWGSRLDRLNLAERATLRLGRVGFVFQNFYLLPHLTVWENVLLPLRLAQWADPTAGATEILARMGLLARKNDYPECLSGGEQQRIALARAYAFRPKILFADEPTGNLDGFTRDSMLDLLFELNAEQQTALVLVSHDPYVAARCGQIVTLPDKQVS